MTTYYVKSNGTDIPFTSRKTALLFALSILNYRYEYSEVDIYYKNAKGKKDYYGHIRNWGMGLVYFYKGMGDRMGAQVLKDGSLDGKIRRMY